MPRSTICCGTSRAPKPSTIGPGARARQPDLYTGRCGCTCGGTGTSEGASGVRPGQNRRRRRQFGAVHGGAGRAVRSQIRRAIAVCRRHPGGSARPGALHPRALMYAQVYGLMGRATWSVPTTIRRSGCSEEVAQSPGEARLHSALGSPMPASAATRSDQRRTGGRAPADQQGSVQGYYAC